ncbi:MAG: DNA-processing protein DprA [Cypionkella sp.]
MAQGPTTAHTPSPALQDADPALWLRLIRSRRVGPATFHRLLADHGTVEAALAALPEIARAAGVREYSLCPIEVVRHEMSQARAAGARLLLWGQGDYPQSLMDLSDAPPILWAQGDLALLNRPMVALVGARNASSLGLRMTRRLVEGLAGAGQVVVSGLARGIDAEAHQAALATGTVAVQAGGVDVVYPLENADLAAEIAAKGCRISEQPMGLQPQARHFPQRNRIVSGLARAVVVVEAAARSGSLITAKNALDQGREVLAVPGHPFDARAAGCNLLLRDGATLVRSANDVLEAIGLRGDFMAHPTLDLIPMAVPDPLPGPVPQRRPLTDIAAVHSEILARLGPSPLAEDQLIRDLALPQAALAPALIQLEMQGRIQRQAGGLLSRID